MSFVHRLWTTPVWRRPPHESWSLVVGRKRIEFATQDEVGRWLRRGSRAALVAPPGGHEFLPVPAVSALRATERGRFPIDLRWRAFAFACAGAVLLYLAFATRRLELLGMGGGAVGLALVLGIDASFLGRSQSALEDRLRFLHWCEADDGVRRLRLLVLAFLATIGGGQLVAQEFLGGMPALWEAFGLVYDRVSIGEGWRFLTGPLLHYDVAHFVVNGVLLLMLSGFVRAAAPRLAAPAFLLACAFAALAQFFLGGRAFDNFGGISGGVYAWFGLAAGRGDRLPPGVPLLLLGLAVVCIASTEVISAHAATTAHGAGLLVGIGMGWVARGIEERGSSKVERGIEVGRS